MDFTCLKKACHINQKAIHEAFLLLGLDLTRVAKIRIGKLKIYLWAAHKSILSRKMSNGRLEGGGGIKELDVFKIFVSFQR